MCASPHASLVLKPCEGMVPPSRLLFSLDHTCRPSSRHQFPAYLALDYTAVHYRTLSFSRCTSQKADGHQYQYHYCSVPVHFVATRLNGFENEKPFPCIHNLSITIICLLLSFSFLFWLNGNKAFLKKKNIENGENWHHERKIPQTPASQEKDQGKQSCKIKLVFYCFVLMIASPCFFPLWLSICIYRHSIYRH